MTVELGGESFGLDYAVPGPPGVGVPELRPKILELCHGAGRRVRLRMKFPDTWSAWQPLQSNGIGSAVAELCGNACEAIAIGAERDPPSLRDVLSLVRDFRAANALALASASFVECKVESPKNEPPAVVDKETSSIRTGSVTVKGELSPETVGRLLEQELGHLQVCYETALRKDPSFAGRVGIKLVIDETGAVATASNSGTDIPSAELVECAIMWA